METMLAMKTPPIEDASAVFAGVVLEVGLLDAVM
jgi:hypothetical protein